MTAPRKVLLIVDAGATADTASGLAEALRDVGAEVQVHSLAPPYEALLDALASGWLAVHVPQAAAAADAVP